MARICIMTAGHLATCHRMMKAADALAAEHEVRVISTRHVAWATAGDAAVRRDARWRWSVVGYDRGSSRAAFLKSGLRARASRAMVAAMGVGRVPSSIAVRAFSRVHDELVDAALVEPADLYYAGTNGALAAAAAAAAQSGARYALDLEDFHSGEHDESGACANALAERIETGVLSQAVFLTTASTAMAAAYRHKYAVDPQPIHNTFPLPPRPPDFSRPRSGELSFYWFSQTIGLDRGLQEAISAIREARIAAELHLRGIARPEVIDHLRRLAGSVPRLNIRHEPPSDPDTMVDRCRDHHVGLSLERTNPVSRAVCLPNKALTYPLAGLAVAVTDTPGQRPFAEDLGDGALVYAPGDIDALARGLARWANNPALLCRARMAAWEAARRRWHWEHEQDRGALVALVESAVS